MNKFLKMISVGVFFLAVLLIYGQVTPTEEWVARYNGPDSSGDWAEDIAVDSSGNVYVTGYGNTDYLTIKYDTDGNELWVALFDGPAGISDHSYAIAVDLLGNVYVTGVSGGSGYGTVAYDTTGTQLWVAYYGGGSASDIALDASGNVYVTGFSGGSGTADDYATIAYDSTGTQLWVARYNGPGNSYDKAWAIAVDSLSGHVYVTGYSPDSGTGQDYATVAYDSTGAQLWVARYDGPGNTNDRAATIALDSFGNVYVTGSSGGSGTGDDYATIAYDSTGAQLWVARYNGPGNTNDGAEAIAVDSFGNVYVTGSSGGSGTGDDYATIAYDSIGTQLWVARYSGSANGEDCACSLALDSAGNVYVTGWIEESETSWDFGTIAYDSTGAQLWVARYNGSENLEDGAGSLALDSAGNVYVTGWIEGSETDWDLATIKYSTDSIPPVLNVSVSPDTLWPPDHKMDLITPTITVTDNVDPNPVVVLTSITMNEGDLASTYDPNFDEIRSDGKTQGDILVDENGNIYLRAERRGNGTGRVYTLFYTATDASGNSSTAIATVTVPHDQQ